MNEEEIFREHDFELAMEIMSKYECFNHLTKKETQDPATSSPGK
jgi:hypothetical protein